MGLELNYDKYFNIIIEKMQISVKIITILISIDKILTYFHIYLTKKVFYINIIIDISNE